MRYLLLVALATVLVYGGCTDGDDNADMDASTDTDSNSDSDTYPEDGYLEECISICGEQTSQEICQAMSVPQDPDVMDYWQYCAWGSFVETSLSGDGGCHEGEIEERCYCSGQGEGGAEFPINIEGCGEVDGYFRYFEKAGSLFFYFGVNAPQGSEYLSCQFDLGGYATPEECVCFCDWPQDLNISCDYSLDVCMDQLNGLMWQASDGSTIGISTYEWSLAKNHCLSLVHNGFSDWRLPELEELRTLVRGCPQNEAAGSCPLVSSCVDVTCAGADCVECNWSSGPSNAGDNCIYCAMFADGPCAACGNLAGPGWQGCYLPVELDWECGPLWTNNEATPIPADHSSYAWAIDFNVGAPMVHGTYQEGSTIWGSGGQALCVRDL